MYQWDGVVKACAAVLAVIHGRMDATSDCGCSGGSMGEWCLIGRLVLDGIRETIIGE